MLRRSVFVAVVCAWVLLGAQGSVLAEESAKAEGSVKAEVGTKAEVQGEAKLGEPGDLKKQRHLVEIGSFGGIFMPDTGDHQWHARSLPQRSLEDSALELGARLAYLPIPYLGIEAEAAYMPTTTSDGLAAQLLAVRGHLLAQYPARLSPFLTIGLGGIGVRSSNSALGDDTDLLFHWGVGLKVYATRWFQFRFDFRHNLGPGEDTKYAHHFELLAGLSFVIGWKSEYAPKDTDGDGILDDVDKCPKQPETKNGYQDEDGCPDEVPDTDGDGIRDDKDKCINDPETKNGYQDEDGCPDQVPDTDGDGLADDKDKCPTVPAKTEDGCPIPDADGDGIPDAKDKCVNEPETKNGYQDEDGCPDEVPVEVKKFTGVIQGITFDYRTARIRKSSYPTLDAAYKTLVDFNDLKLVIRGHTDDIGGREWNLDLSKRRADAVREYLVNKGINGDRLRTEGLAFDEPVADNKSEEGRSKNRRIEFRLDVK